MGFAIDTERLTLREMAHDDLDFVAAMLSHPEVMRFYTRLYTRAEASIWLEQQIERYARDGHGLWLVRERDTGAEVGQIGLVMQPVDGHREPEVGYLLDRPFWGRGYATEAAAATRDWAFQNIAAERLVSLIRPVNEPSQAVARRLGMTPTSRTLHAGLDHWVFSLPRPSAHG